MTGIVQLIKSDYQRYTATGGGTANPLGIIFLTQGLWASSVYRVAHAVRLIRHPSILNRLVDSLLVLLQKFVEIITSIHLPADCEIGDGLYIGHFGPVIVNEGVRIGNNCNLSQCVTIGVVQRGTRQGVPVIGNRVYIGPHAVVIGGIQVGNDAAIGAGAVVTRSVPASAVVAGNPAKIISHQGSFEMVKYTGMESDPERNNALKQRPEINNGIHLHDG